jgi:hypothetical protein
MNCRNTKGTDCEGIRLGGRVAAGRGKADPGGRGVENARVYGRVEVQAAHVPSGMVSSVAGLLAWAPAADPKRGVRDWDFGWASGGVAASLALTVVQEMRDDADWNPATRPVPPPAREG